MNKFPPENYFDLENCYFSEIFDREKPVWDSLKVLQEYLRKQFDEGKLARNYRSDLDAHIGEGTTIEEGVKIVGPVIFGKNCSIGHAVFMRGGCLIGNNVHIGHASEIKASIILNDSAVAHLNYVGDSIIGNGVNVSGGALFANYRFDKMQVSVRTENGKVETGLAKFGAIVGDNSNVGVNAMLNPGTILGKNTLVYPLHSVSGEHKENEIIK